MKLYTCDSGKWLYENGDSFEAWNEEEQQANPQKDVYIFEVDEELTEKLKPSGHRITPDSNLQFLKVF